MQKFVHRFERTEESREAIPQMPWRFALSNKIARAKLVRQSDHSRSHGPVFMRSSRPGNAFLRIDPNRKSHRG
jgi:hypothetical protein